MAASESKGVRLLDSRRVELSEDSFGRLALSLSGEDTAEPAVETHADVRLVRCFPLTRPHEFLSIQDAEGVEIGILTEIGGLGEASRCIVERWLADYYLTARVEGIDRVETRSGIITWLLRTDRGPKTVYLRDRQHARPLRDGRTILIDIYDARYEIPPSADLDPRSRHWLEIEL